MNFRRVLAIARLETRLLRRDPMIILRAIGTPLVLMLLFGYGLSLDVEHIPFAVVDYDHSATSRDYIYTFAGNRTFDLVSAGASEREVEAMLRRGDVRLAIIVPPQFERTLYHGLPATVQLMVDGVYAFRAEITRGYALAAHERAAEDIMRARIRERTGKLIDLQPIDVRTRYLFNENLRTTNTIVPGLLPMILMMTPAVMMALAIVREKELGSIYNFFSSPATRAEFVIGKLMPYVVISFANALFLGLLTVILFGVPFKGSLAIYAAGMLVYVAATAGIGLLVSSFVKSQLGANIVTMIMTIVPSALYSGMLIPVSSMSPLTRAVAHLFPGMFGNNIVIGTFLKDLPLRAMLSDFATLALFIIVFMGAGIALTPKRER